ncbi:hypothetical protein [Halalkalibaculum sp. DA3122]
MIILISPLFKWLIVRIFTFMGMHLGVNVEMIANMNTENMEMSSLPE